MCRKRYINDAYLAHSCLLALCLKVNFLSILNLNAWLT